jgi:hypothetical protein
MVGVGGAEPAPEPEAATDTADMYAAGLATSVAIILVVGGGGGDGVSSRLVGVIDSW